MNDRKIFTISFFLGETFFLGFGYSLLFYYTGADAWISMILGSFIGFILIFFLEQIKKRQEKYPIQHVVLQKIVYFIFNFFISSQILFTFQTFASSFYLVKSPTWFVTLPIPYLMYRVSKSGYVTVGKIGEMLFPFTIFIVAFSFIGLTNHFDYDAFLPIMTESVSNILKGALLFATYTTIPYYLFLSVPMEKKKLLKKYALSSLLVISLGVVIIAVIGPNLIRIYRYPEYIILKEIKIFNFVEKVENIVALVWIFNLAISLAVCSCNMRQCMPKKNRNLLFCIITILLYFLCIFESVFYPKELMLYHELPYIFLGIQVFLILFSYFCYKKNT